MAINARGKMIKITCTGKKNLKEFHLKVISCYLNNNLSIIMISFIQTLNGKNIIISINMNNINTSHGCT